MFKKENNPRKFPYKFKKENNPKENNPILGYICSRHGFWVMLNFSSTFRPYKINL